MYYSTRAEFIGTALYLAAKQGHSEVVELLLNEDADVNVKRNDGDTALHVAAMYDRKEVVELLLSECIEIDVQNDFCYTSLHEAVWRGHKQVVKLLLNKGADVDIVGDFGKTALQLAQDHHGRLSEIAALLQRRRMISDKKRLHL